MMSWRDRLLSAAAACVLLAGCASVHNLPVNLPLDGAVADRVVSDVGMRSEDAMIGLSFSGGGTRAAAFSFGVLSEMERVPLHGARSAMLDRVAFVSGVSGGSVTAAYFGLKGRDALSDFRERFLLRNAEEGLETTLSLGTIGKAFTGGINDSVGFTRWLDAHLFEGATFARLRAGDRPMVWINASDIYNRVPFVFNSTAFSAICSDLDAYPLSSAVAASAAVPLAFAPAVMQAFPGACNTPLPRWVRRAATEGNSSPMLSSYAKAVLRYREGAVPFIKLLDGGLVDNYGVSALTIARESSETPYGPLTPQQAVKLRRLMMLVVDAKTGVSGNWVDTVEGPSGVELIKAAVDTTMDASVGASYTAFDRTMSDWRDKLVRWRCGLSAADRARYGAGPGWDCRDLRFFVGRLAFDQLEPGRAATLERIATRFVLSPQQVDELISAGRDVLRQSPVFRAFAASL
ncbi:patatin-like phospholipase family protein [Rhodopseudomonas sp. WA056]|uniref:patatin-like phospholipase family protein n=1 Tax=Rhodopseudomonas sp. WA056 TaxID=2269367 RepID=UPI0013DEB6BE|nr:patatin-like phospholipase family protein [Rhodopseudomonas sp. WA056]NEW88493.1 patatin-like phospholipase family protein [Rhodopseudomonas sp. WA056]